MLPPSFRPVICGDLRDGSRQGQSPRPDLYITGFGRKLLNDTVVRPLRGALADDWQTA
jgi:hypothetical protein